MLDLMIFFFFFRMNPHRSCPLKLDWWLTCENIHLCPTIVGRKLIKPQKTTSQSQTKTTTYTCYSVSSSLNTWQSKLSPWSQLSVSRILLLYLRISDRHIRTANNQTRSPLKCLLTFCRFRFKVPTIGCSNGHHLNFIWHTTIFVCVFSAVCWFVCQQQARAQIEP